MIPRWISNTIYVSQVKDAGPIWRMLHELIETIRNQDDSYHFRQSIDLEFLHSTICYSGGEFQIILHFLSSVGVMEGISSFISQRYGSFYVKCVEIDSGKDVVNFLAHENGILQGEKTVSKGLSKHLVEEIEKSPMKGRCFSFTVPELFNQKEQQFIETLQDLKYNSKSQTTQDPEDDLLF
ncbi:hypothetical protein [Salinispira pacifica]|uniref:Uncharacterized protein n=1 Tax=Salinispira pacifica TaxID=1307761 RepID=V5WFD3_9SPIO|nr:hypothetical protein [Salinispira pacifica]AHC13891.1 hypothetical protein L21SP2_0459 [Salinispira pacifica]